MKEDNEEMIMLPMKEIRAKNDALWTFVRLEFPFASGDLDDYLRIALEKAKHERGPK